MTTPQHWEDRRLARGAGLRSIKHFVVSKAKTKYGVTEPPHHEIRFTDKMDGTTLLVKVFEDRIAMSMNGPFNITPGILKSMAEMISMCQTECDGKPFAEVVDPLYFSS